jgi:hypothetical protein
MNKPKNIARTLIIAFAVLAYHVGKDVVKIGIKDGKVTHELMAKK